MTNPNQHSKWHHGNCPIHPRFKLDISFTCRRCRDNEAQRAKRARIRLAASEKRIEQFNKTYDENARRRGQYD